MRFRPGGPNRRGGPFGAPRNPFQAAALQSLAQANQLLTDGRPAEAAAIFAQLAGAVEARGNLRRAGYLNLQAARSLALVPDGAGTVKHAAAGLRLFQAAGLAGQASLAYGRIVGLLRARGLTAEADQLQREMAPRLGAPPAPGADPAAPAARLPARCPQCGGPIRPDEVEWTPGGLAGQPAAADCPYCGSVLYPE